MITDTDKKTSELYEEIKHINICKNDLHNNYAFRNAFKAYILPVSEIRTKINGDCVAPYYTYVEVNGKKRKLGFPNIKAYFNTVDKLCKDDKILHLINSSMNSSNNLMELSPDYSDFNSNGSRKLLKKIKNDIVYNQKYIYKVDISKFYESIYTHNLENIDKDLKPFDELIRRLNTNKTNGIIMGPLLSLCAANIITNELSIKIKRELFQLGYDVDCKYFSDQFYIYSNKPILDFKQKVENAMSDNEYFYSVNYNDSYKYNLKEVIQDLIIYDEIDNLFINKSYLSDSYYGVKLLEEYSILDTLKNIEYYVMVNEISNERTVIYMINKLFIQTKIRSEFYSIIKSKEKDKKVETYEIINRLMTLLFLYPSIITAYEELGITTLMNIALENLTGELRSKYTNIIETKIHSLIIELHYDEWKICYFVHMYLVFEKKDKRRKFFIELLTAIESVDMLKYSILLNFIYANGEADIKKRVKEMIDKSEHDPELDKSSWLLKILILKKEPHTILMKVDRYREICTTNRILDLIKKYDYIAPANYIEKNNNDGILDINLFRYFSSDDFSNQLVQELIKDKSNNKGANDKTTTVEQLIQEDLPF